MPYTTIKTRREGGIYHAQIHRPEIDNKLSVACMDELREALAEAAGPAGCSAFVLSGLPEIFCAGGELGDYRQKSIVEIKAFGAAFIALHLAIRDCPLPVIAAVEGDALGGGFSLVEACDLAVAAESARFAIPEIRDGLAPAMGLSGIYANLPKKQIMELGLLGAELTAAKALALGMVNAVVPRAAVSDAAAEMAGRFRTASPTSVRLFKELCAGMGMNDYENRLRMGRSMMVELFKSEDGAEALASKEERRSPVWKNA